MSNNDKRYKTEWSFDFATIGDRISDWAKSSGLNNEEAIQQSTFTEPLDGVGSARVTLEFSVGQVRVHPIETANLVEADITHVGDIVFAAQRDDSGAQPAKQVHLHQSGAAQDWLRNVFGWIGSGQRLRWDVGLTTRIPLDLTIKGGAGKCEFDLRGLQVSDLRVNTGVGEVNLILPAGHYSAHIDCGVGRTDVVVPHGAEIELDLNAGTGEVNLEIGEAASVLARINGGVGAVNIQTARDGVARVEVQRGLGGVNVTGGLVRQGESVWQSPGYESAERRTTIFYRAGVGAFNVR